MKFFTFVISVIFLNKGLALNIEDLDIDIRIKDQINAGFSLKESIDMYSNNQGSNNFATVGSDINCDYRFGSTKIQDAIDLGETEIRIAMNDTYNVGLLIHDKSIIIRGGYTDCTAAAVNIQTDKTRIGHLPMESVITITGSSQRNSIVLDSLELTEGAGGINVDNADVEVILSKLFIFNNSTSLGGGVRISGGNTDLFIEDTAILSNEAIDGGGGIFCNSNNASIVLNKSSGITLNKVTGINEVAPGVVFGFDGGGAYIQSGCSFLSYASGTGGLFDFRGIFKNEATGSGGGIFSFGGSIITLFGHQVCKNTKCMGSNENPSYLAKNKVGVDSSVVTVSGGGVYVTGVGTVLSIYASLVSENQAINGSGGAILISSDASFNTGRLSKSCWSQEHCNLYEKNTAQTGGMLSSSGVATINSTVIENNRADFATVMSLNVNSMTTINSSLIHHNGNNQADGFDDNNVIGLVNQNAVLTMNHSTIADNNAVSSVFFVGDDSSPNSLISSSIIHDSSTGPINSPNTTGSIAVNCSLMHEENSITSQSFSVVVNDPGFVDRANRDYHITPNTSLAVDFCFENNSIQLDIDFEPRGFDDPIVNDNLGVFDVGVDETYTSDVIFKNDFD